MIKEHVNKPNTPTWIRMNEDAQQFRWQDIFIRNFGGRFEVRESRRGRCFYWIDEEKEKEESLDKILSEENEQYVIETSNKTIEFAQNLSEYCRQNNLNKAAMYATLRGDRKHHKGNKLLKIPK